MIAQVATIQYPMMLKTWVRTRSLANQPDATVSFNEALLANMPNRPTARTNVSFHT